MHRDWDASQLVDVAESNVSVFPCKPPKEYKKSPGPGIELLMETKPSGVPAIGVSESFTWDAPDAASKTK
jgi:hypothetical protein